jgi:hypothetical protein
MPYSPHPTSDIIYLLINASPVGTGEQLLDSLILTKIEVFYQLDKRINVSDAPVGITCQYFSAPKRRAFNH